MFAAYARARSLPRYPSGQTVVLEAMATAKPLVLTDSPAMRDYVRRTSRQCWSRPAIREAVAGALDELLADSARRRRLGLAGREAVERRFNQEQLWAQVAAGLRLVLR